MVQVNVVHIEDAQQHVRVSLRVVREHNVTVPLEFTVYATNKLDRYFLMRVPMRVPHVGSLVNQHVIQNVAVAVGSIPQFLAEVRQILDVIPVDPGVVGLIRRDIAVVRRSMPWTIPAACREVGGTEVAAQHQRGDAGDVRLERHRDQVVHDLEVGIVVCRYAEWDFERRAGGFRFAGYVLNSPFDLTNVLEIVFELDLIARRDALLQASNLAGDGIENTTGPLSVDDTLVRARAVSEQALESHAGIDFCRKRGRRCRPRDGVRVTATVTPVAVAGIVTGILDTELNGRQQRVLAVLVRDYLVDRDTQIRTDRIPSRAGAGQQVRTARMVAPRLVRSCG